MFGYEDIMNMTPLSYDRYYGYLISNKNGLTWAETISNNSIIVRIQDREYGELREIYTVRK